MIDTAQSEANALLRRYRIGDRPLYLVGTFADGVTVLSQQTRALNLVCALIESGVVPSGRNIASARKRLEIAVIGAGFSGLTVAAGLIRKECHANITLFEQRDTLLPLQQGSDSRWLHPRIYNWPEEGSEASAAMLPILNWTAGRASDVVVQLLSEWRELVRRRQKSCVLDLHCNARHLQVHEAAGTAQQLQIEWIGEARNAEDGTAQKSRTATASGESKTFDLVILTVGFGLEKKTAFSYWRNETLGQPRLDQPRHTYVVSGQGDGAIIDLMRLRISQFRQDRILSELFAGRPKLLNEMKSLRTKYGSGEQRGLFNAFERTAKNSMHKREFEDVRLSLARRLRRDTEVILHLKVKKLAELFERGVSRLSFQNRLLLYLLYRCGGFYPACGGEDLVIEQHKVAGGNIILRHGPDRRELLRAILSDELWCELDELLTLRGISYFDQPDSDGWPGGYFGFPGPLKEMPKLPDELKAAWRKEYLPGPLELMATSLCSAISGYLCSRFPKPGRLRVTFFRTITVGRQEWLQQCCEYLGKEIAPSKDSTAARTFNAHHATIGRAYLGRGVVRSVKGVTPTVLKKAMGELELNVTSRKMSGKVGFVLAIPIVEPEDRYTAPGAIAGMIYVDSEAKGFFLDNSELKRIVAMMQAFVNSIERVGGEGPPQRYNRIRNFALSDVLSHPAPRLPVPGKAAHALEIVDAVMPPRASKPLQFNLDFADFSPVQEGGQ